MANRTLSIVDQISQLETDLAKSHELNKRYEKAIDKFCKTIFGKSAKEIQSIIEDADSNEISRQAKTGCNEIGEDTAIDEGNDVSEGQRPSAF